MKTMKQRVAEYQITMTTEPTDRNPNMADDEWGRTASHYKCKLRRPGHQMTVYFSMGSAHTKEPTAEDVINSVAGDAASIENARGFEDWAADLGYDTDSRKAARVYKACQAEAEKLRRFAGNDYDALLFDTESL